MAPRRIWSRRPPTARMNNASLVLVFARLPLHNTVSLKPSIKSVLSIQLLVVVFAPLFFRACLSPRRGAFEKGNGRFHYPNSCQSFSRSSHPSAILHFFDRTCTSSPASRPLVFTWNGIRVREVEIARYAAFQRKKLERAGLGINLGYYYICVTFFFHFLISILIFYVFVLSFL